MDRQKIIRELDTLPPDAQRQVAEYINYLQKCYRRSGHKKKRSKTISSETFLGIWRDRQDMKNSSAWVRRIRESEWGKYE